MENARTWNMKHHRVSEHTLRITVDASTNLSSFTEDTLSRDTRCMGDCWCSMGGVESLPSWHQERAYLLSVRFQRSVHWLRAGQVCTTWSTRHHYDRVGRNLCADQNWRVVRLLKCLDICAQSLPCRRLLLACGCYGSNTAFVVWSATNGSSLESRLHHDFEMCWNNKGREKGSWASTSTWFWCIYQIDNLPECYHWWFGVRIPSSACGVLQWQLTMRYLRVISPRPIIVGAFETSSWKRRPDVSSSWWEIILAGLIQRPCLAHFFLYYMICRRTKRTKMDCQARRAGWYWWIPPILWQQVAIGSQRTPIFSFEMMCHWVCYNVLLCTCYCRILGLTRIIAWQNTLFLTGRQRSNFVQLKCTTVLSLETLLESTIVLVL